MYWADTYRVCTGAHLHIADILPCVDMISWDCGRIGMGYRTRRRGDYLLVLQKPPLRARATWRDRGIPNRWTEKVDRRIHPHAKPAGLIARLIAAVTQPGDLVVDPAAGGFTVMHVAHELGRRFVGCDIAYGDVPSPSGCARPNTARGPPPQENPARASGVNSPFKNFEYRSFCHD